MEDLKTVFWIGIGLLVLVGDMIYRVFVNPARNDEDIARYEEGNFLTHRKHQRSNYISARVAKGIRDNLGLDEPGKFEIPDWAKDDEEKSRSDAWKCPDCGRLNHSFQDTCACSYRKET